MKASVKCDDNPYRGTKTFTFAFEVQDEEINNTNFGWLLAKAQLDRKMGLVSDSELASVLLVELATMVKSFEDFKIQRGLEKILGKFRDIRTNAEQINLTYRTDNRTYLTDRTTTEIVLPRTGV